MSDFELKYQPYGIRSILIEWPPEISEKILNDILIFKEAIKNNYTKQIVEVNHGYNSILVTYDVAINNIYSCFSELKACYSELNGSIKLKSSHWNIPVCYDEKFGLDLRFLSEEKNLSIDAIIECHSKPIYSVYFTGFLPGFLYLGGLDDRLFQPRRSDPRLSVEKGSVAIGGQQTGIYPCDSPGGWHIIGKTPISLFDPTKNTPCFAKAGDKISFQPVNLEEFEHLKKEIENGTYELEKLNL